jgi:thiol-disulfide isomerase/thioredoxin
MNHSRRIIDGWPRPSALFPYVTLKVSKIVKMKKTLIFCLSLFFICLSGKAQGKQFVIKGRLPIDHVSQLLITRPGHSIYNSDTVSVSADGSFDYTCNLDEDGLGMIYVPDKTMYTILMVGNTVTTVRPQSDAPDGIAFEGPLASAYKCFHRALRASMTLQDRQFSDFAQLHKAYSDTAQALRAQFASVEQAGARRILNDYLNEILEDRLTGYYETLETQGKEVQGDAAYNAFMEQLPLDNITRAKNYVYWKGYSNRVGGNLDCLYMLKVAKSKLRQQSLLEKLSVELGVIYYQAVDSRLDDVHAMLGSCLTDSAHLKWENDLYKAHRKTMPGAPAIDCQLLDPNGKTCSLSSLFGKVLFIDIWATWCVPCCAEIPHVAKLVEKFKGDDRIEFVSISCGRNQDAWHKKLAADQSPWKQYLSTNITNLYGITGIPFFMMIDASGKILTTQPPRPSDPQCYDFIRKQLDGVGE